MRATWMLASVVAVSILGTAVGARAGDQPQPPDRPKPIELKAVGEAKEIPVGREVSGCHIEVTEGNVVINTIVVRARGQKTPITVAKKLSKGQSLDLPLGPKQMVDGLRISDGGGGVYKIFICADPPPGSKAPEPPQRP